MNAFFCKTIEITIGDVSWEEDIEIEVDYTLGRSNKNSGEMLNICGRRVRGPALNPPDPAEIDICAVTPQDPNVKWSMAMKEAIFRSLDKDDLWEDIDEQQESMAAF